MSFKNKTSTNIKNNKQQIAIILIITILCTTLFGCTTNGSTTGNIIKENVITNNEKPVKSLDPIKIGFIGPMSGSFTKLGAYEAVQLAVEDINAQGGINGAPLEVIYEDGKCESKSAADAVNKLVNIDKVKFILGGHCTPESVTIAPIVEENKVIMLASITTTPVLTSMGDYVFRTSPVSLVQADILAKYAHDSNYKNMAIIYEQSAYTAPLAEHMKKVYEENKGKILLYEGYNTGTTDFRTIIAKAKEKNIDAIFFAPLSPDASLIFMKQSKELEVKAQIFGNDVTGIAANTKASPETHEGLILAMPDWNQNDPKTREFIDKYNTRFHTTELPYGIWTADCYDATMILAQGLIREGHDTEKIKEYLYTINNYNGVSGKISIDSNGDGVRIYNLKIIRNGVMENLKS